MNGYAEGYQAADSLALKLPNVVPSDLRASVIESLVKNIVANDHHLTTGIVGVAALFPVLSEAGYHDLAVLVATQTTYPSFGFMFNNAVQNATTNWETFHALLQGQGGTDSLNHHMFNSIGAWFYRYLAGIQLDGLDADLILHPRLTRHLDQIEAEVRTLAGPLLVSWQQEKETNRVLYHTTIPNSFSAIITFEPMRAGMRCQSITENGRSRWNSSNPTMIDRNGIDWIEPHPTIEGAMSVKVHSGAYSWDVQWK